MTVGKLSTWKIETSQPFYPIGMACIGDDANNRAVITYAPHTVNTLIFRNFIKDIKNNVPAHKSFMHKSFFPECIKEILVGKNESVILFENGRLKYFTSTKTLMNVPYLMCVKTMCATQNGFVLIKTSQDGTEFFVEFHPNSFEQSNVQKTKNFDISFEKMVELQSSWLQCNFKIKELFVRTTNFQQKALEDDIATDQGTCNWMLFISIDNTFCYLSYDKKSSFTVNVVTVCSAKIVNFWSSSNEYIALLLESGIIEILHVKLDQNEINKEYIYCGTGIKAHYFNEDMIIYSNKIYVECILFGKRGEKLNRQCFNLPGIVALTYLPELQLVLCLSENCGFYYVPLQNRKQCVDQWIGINDDMQTHISNLRYEVIQLADEFEAIVKQQQQQQQFQNVIKLKQNNDCVERNHHFVGRCSVTQTLPVQQRVCDESNIYISNSLAYDSVSSFFVCITILYTTKYANDFETNLCRLYCMWLNDKLEHVYANIELKNKQLPSQSPLNVIIHLNQKHLPNFHLDFSVSGNGSTLIQMNFPIKVEQPNYCELMNISSPKKIEPVMMNANGSSLIYTLSTLSPKSIVEILGKNRMTLCIYLKLTNVNISDFLSLLLQIEKFLHYLCNTNSIFFYFMFDICGNPIYSVFVAGQLDLMKQSSNSKESFYMAKMMGRELTMIFNSENKTFRFITKDADFMTLLKRHVHGKDQITSKDVKVSLDTMMEYIVI